MPPHMEDADSSSSSEDNPIHTNPFTNIDIDALASDSDESTAGGNSTTDAVNNSGYERPVIDAESIIKDFQQTFESGQSAFSFFQHLLDASGEALTNHTSLHEIEKELLTVAHPDPSDELSPDEQAILDQYDVSTQAGQVEAFEALTKYIEGKERLNDLKDVFLKSQQGMKQKNQPHDDDPIGNLEQMLGHQLDESQGHIFPLYQWRRVTPNGHVIKKVLEHGYPTDLTHEETKHGDLLHAMKEKQFEDQFLSSYGNKNGIDNHDDFGYDDDDDDDDIDDKLDKFKEALSFLQQTNHKHPIENIPRSIGLHVPLHTTLGTPSCPQIKSLSKQTHPSSLKSENTDINSTNQHNTNASDHHTIDTFTTPDVSFLSGRFGENTESLIPPISIPLPASFDDIQRGKPPALSRVYGLLSIRMYNMQEVYAQAQHEARCMAQSSSTAPSSIPSQPIKYDPVVGDKAFLSLPPHRQTALLASLRPDVLYSSLHEEVSLLLGQNQSLRGLELGISTMNVGERALILSSGKYGGKMTHLGSFTHQYDKSCVSSIRQSLNSIQTIQKKQSPQQPPQHQQHTQQPQQNQSSSSQQQSQQLVQAQQHLIELLTSTFPLPVVGNVLHSSKNLTTPSVPSYYRQLITPLTHQVGPPLFKPKHQISSSIQQTAAPSTSSNAPIFELTKSAHIIHNITYNMMFEGLKHHKIRLLQFMTKIRSILPCQLPSIAIIPPFEGRLTALLPNQPMRFIQHHKQHEHESKQDITAQTTPRTSHSLVSLPPQDSPFEPLYRFVLSHPDDPFDSPHIPLSNDKCFQDILQLTNEPSTSSTSSSTTSASSTRSSVTKQPTQLPTANLPSNPSTLSGHSAVYSEAPYILEFDFTLTRYEHEVNLHTMNTEEKLIFIQQRRILAKYLYSTFNKLQSSAVQYLKALTVVEDDAISETQAYNDDKASFQHGKQHHTGAQLHSSSGMKPMPRNTPQTSSQYDQHLQRIDKQEILGQQKQQVLPQLSKQQRQLCSAILYGNVLQCCYYLANSLYRYNVLLFYYNLYKTHLSSSMLCSPRIWYYAVRIQVYKEEWYTALSQYGTILEQTDIYLKCLQDNLEQQTQLCFQAAPVHHQSQTESDISNNNHHHVNDLISISNEDIQTILTYCHTLTQLKKQSVSASASASSSSSSLLTTTNTTTSPVPLAHQSNSNQFEELLPLPPHLSLSPDQRDNIQFWQLLYGSRLDEARKLRVTLQAELSALQQLVRDDERAGRGKSRGFLLSGRERASKRIAAAASGSHTTTSAAHSHDSANSQDLSSNSPSSAPATTTASSPSKSTQSSTVLKRGLNNSNPKSTSAPTAAPTTPSAASWLPCLGARCQRQQTDNQDENEEDLLGLYSDKPMVAPRKAPPQWVAPNRWEGYKNAISLASWFCWRQFNQQCDAIYESYFAPHRPYRGARPQRNWFRL